MMGTIYLITFFLIATPILTIAFYVLQKKNERRRKEEEWNKEMAERKRIEKEQEEARIKYQKSLEEAAKKQKEKEEKNSAEFEEDLSQLSLVEIVLSDQKINNNLVLDMEEIKITKPRNNSKYSSYGRFTVIDVETTGVKIQSEIIEISAIKYFDFEPISAFTTLVKPKDPIPHSATFVNNITDEMVKNAPTIKQVMPALIDFIGKDNLLGHNIEFDLKFLYKYGFNFQEQKRKYYDTLEIAKSKLTKYRYNDSDDNNFDEYDVFDYKLDTICKFYDIYRKDSHRSLSDCLATAKVFIKLLDNYDLLKDSDI